MAVELSRGKRYRFTSHAITAARALIHLYICPNMLPYIIAGSRAGSIPRLPINSNQSQL
jgi:hypothetical protein